MIIEKALNLMNKYEKCPECGNKMLGKGQGKLIVEDTEFIRECKCGYKIKTDEDGNEIKPKEIDLQQALIENAKTNVAFGITFEQLKKHQNKIFFDKWGIPWKFVGEQIYYNEQTYPNKRFRSDLWHEGYMESTEFKVTKFFKREEFEKIKPGYL